MSRALALLALAAALPASATEPKFRVGRPTDFATTVMAFAPDGKTVAVTTNRGYTGGMDAPVHIWDCETGKHVRALKYHTVGVMAVAFSPDGKLIATSGIDNKLRFWDAQTGKDVTKEREIALTGHGYNLNFSPDGKRLLVGSTKLELFDAETQKPVKKDHFAETGTSQFFHAAAWSPKGKYVAAGADGGAVCLWDAATGALERKLDARLTPGRTRISFSPDDSLVLVSSWHGGVFPDSMFKIFDTATGKERANVKMPAGEIGPDNIQFARLKGRTARLVQEFQGRARPLVVTDATGTEVARFEVPAGVASHKLSDDGARLAVGGTDGSLRIYDAETGKLARAVIGPWSEVFRTAYTADGKVLRVIHTNGTIGDYDADTGAPLKDRALKLGASTFPVTASADGKLFVTCTDAGEPTVWDAATGEEKAKPKATFFGHRELRFGRDGPFPLPPLPPGGAGRVRVPPAVIAAKFPPPPPVETPGPPQFFATFSADGALLAAVTGKEGDAVTVFDTATGAEKARVKPPKGAGALAFSADGAHLFVGQSRPSGDEQPMAGDAVIARRYDLKTGKEVQSWKALPAEKGEEQQSLRARVAALHPLPNGNSLVLVEVRSVGIDVPPGAPGQPGLRGETVKQRVRVIDLAGREKERALAPSNINTLLGVSPDGKRTLFLNNLVLASADTALEVVDIASGKAEPVPVGRALSSISSGAARATFRPTGTDIALTTGTGEVLVLSSK